MRQIRAALAVPHLREDPAANFMEIEARTREAAQYDVDLVLFPEAALTGFVYVGEIDGYIGGAVAYRADGSVIARRPLHRPGLLMVDLSAKAG